MQVSKVLVVEDFEPVRRFICSVLQQRAEFGVSQASDGLEAVRKAEELQPDLIVLDVGLPGLNGIEVAKRVRDLAPHARVLFLSQEASPDVVRKAFSLGALGYVHKPRARSDLLLAVDAVLRGERFLSDGVELPSCRHEIVFCPDDESIVDSLTRCIAGAISAGNAAIMWATQSRRNNVLEKLRTMGVPIDRAIQRGTYIAANVDEPPDWDRILDAVKSLSRAAVQAGKKHPRVAVCGERAGRLWAEGKTDLAIRVEQLMNELANHQDVDILCAYPLPRSKDGDPVLKSICEEHTAVSKM